MSDVSVTQVLQLEAGSFSGGDGCLPPRLEKSCGVCKPTMEPDRQSAISSGKTASSGYTDRPYLAISTLVSQAVEPVISLPSKIRPQRDLVVEVREGCLPEVLPPLAVWPISGSTTQNKSFQMKLPASSCCHGGTSRHSCTILCAKDGLAGALKRTEILF